MNQKSTNDGLQIIIKSDDGLFYLTFLKLKKN